MSTEAQFRYIAGKCYIETAKLAVMNPDWDDPNRKVASLLPLSMLCGFALELLFKAWLLGSGRPSAAVKAYGHDIRTLYTEVKGCGFPIDADMDLVIDSLASGHKDFTFRYLDAGKTIKNIDWDHAFPVLDRIEVAVDTKIGASASMGLSPGH